MPNRPPSVVVVGAGLSGLTCAQLLMQKGHTVTVVEKARGPGGRMSTRRAAGAAFDHGAPFFEARDADFIQQLRSWNSEDFVRNWDGRVGTMSEDGEVNLNAHERWVGIPGMSSVCRKMAHRLPDCRFGWKAGSVRRSTHGWLLRNDAGELLKADALVISTPPSQALALLTGNGVNIEWPEVRMQSCWAVMALFDQPLSSDWDGVFLQSGPLSWMASQSSKPDRPAKSAWVLHANPAWSEKHAETSAQRVSEILLDAARRLSIAQPVSIEYQRAHFWRYAMASRPLYAGPLYFAEQRLVITGDWTLGSRVEDAWLSGKMAANLLGSAACWH